MCEDRASQLKEIIRLSTKATLQVPNFLLTEIINDYEVYNDFNIALYCLKNDDGVIVTVREVDDDTSEIIIELRDD